MAYTPNVFSIAQKFIDDLKNSGDVVLSSRIGAANGVAGLDSNGDIVATPIHRFDTASAINAIILKSGEIAFTTDTLEWRQGDGTTSGGLFFASQPVAYVGSPTELTSTGSDSVTVTHPTVAGGIYRVWGDASFSGDTDNQSNFQLRMAHVSGFVSSYPTISSLHVAYQWIASTNGGAVTPDVGFFTPVSLVQFPNFGATPTNTTASSGAIRLDAMLATNAANNLTIGMRLRTAKTGSPTILAAHRLFIQRLK